MNFSQEIITVLDYLCKKFGIVIDWTSESVIPYLEDLAARYIQFEVQSSIMGIASTVVIVILLGLIWAVSGAVTKLTMNDVAECICYASLIGFWITFVVCITLSIVNAYHIIECYTIPERVILDYLTGLMESSR